VEKGEFFIGNYILRHLPAAFRHNFWSAGNNQWWSETVGFRTRPVWDQKNRSWSWTLWSWRSDVVLWNTVWLCSLS